MKFGVLGAGQFGSQFVKLFGLHPQVSSVAVVDLVPERADAMRERLGVREVFASFDDLLASDVDAVGIFTQRWTHGPLVVKALRAGKHVYSAVPMAITLEEIQDIVDAVDETGLCYMMGETSFYYPATVFARRKVAEGAFGRVFYSEGEYVHDMDAGFYDAYRNSGGTSWQRTASFPPLLYSTHGLGSVLGAIPTRAVSVSALGVPDTRGDGVFDREVSMFDNDVSNATALYHLADGGILRANEFRRVGRPGSECVRIYGTDGLFEQFVTTDLTSRWTDRSGAVEDVTDLLTTRPTMAHDSPELEGIAPELRADFISGTAPIHDQSRLPSEFRGQPNGHSGSHQFLVDDFVRSVVDGAPVTIDARLAARFTAPGIVAHASSRADGERLSIPDFGPPALEPVALQSTADVPGGKGA